VDDHPVSKKSLSQNFGLLDWRPGPVKVGQHCKNTPLCDIPPREPPNPNEIMFFKSKLEDLPNP